MFQWLTKLLNLLLMNIHYCISILIIRNRMNVMQQVQQLSWVGQRVNAQSNGILTLPVNLWAEIEQERRLLFLVNSVAKTKYAFPWKFMFIDNKSPDFPSLFAVKTHKVNRRVMILNSKQECKPTCLCIPFTSLAACLHRQEWNRGRGKVPHSWREPGRPDS